jgi:PAS domain S-box-containing protein
MMRNENAIDVADLQTLAEYRLLDTPPEAAFDDLAQLAAYIAATSISTITFLDEQRQWFKSRVGLPLCESTRARSFCNYTVRSHQPLIVPDAHQDERFVASPLVVDDPHVRFYAGFPLVRGDGIVLGTLTVMDVVPHQLSDDQIAKLEALARQVVAQLELRRLSFCQDGLSVNSRDVTEWRATREALRTSEERFRIVARATNDAIRDWDIVNNQVWWNEGTETLFGYSRAELEASIESWTDHIHPDDRERIVQLNAELLEQGINHWTAEYRILRKDGSTAYILDRGFVIRDDNDKPVRMIGSMIDLTERKSAEEVLRASEAQYRLLFEHNPHPMWVYDVETLRFLAVNAAATLHYGYSEQELLTMTLSDIRPPQDVARLLQDATRISGRHFGVWRHTKKDGSVIDVEISSDELFFDGRKARIVLANDITARLRAEERIREQAALLDKAQDAIMVRDLSHRITFWNQSAERLYGWRSEEALGRRVDDLLHKDRTRFLKAHEQVMAKGEWMGEVAVMDRQGQDVLVEARWTLVRDDAGNPHSVLAINTNITERKKLEAQFLRAQRLESIGTLAGGIAHDLNNVLAPILLAVGVLKQHERTPSEMRLLNILENSAQKGAAMVRQVLTFARGMDGERVVVQLDGVIHDLARFMRETFDRNIRVIADVPDALWPVLGDPTQIHQLLLNLCVNSRDAMTQGGEVRLSVSNITLDAQYATMNSEARPDQYVLIKVTDTGPGIPAAIRERIFDPFFTTKEVGKGTGLGLATVLALAKSHGGFVNVYSEEGLGTEFRVYLPAYEGKAEAATTVTPVALPRGHGEVVLVVDDEESVRQITRQTLEAFGYRVLLAEDGADAVAVYWQHRADIRVVLTDMMMPVMDGYATIQALRKIDPHVKIVSASGLAANGMIANTANMGVKYFLSKPYTAETVLRMLAEVLESDAL